MGTLLLPKVLRCGSPQDVHRHLKTVSEQLSEDDITKQLIHYIDIGLITSHAFAQWLCISRDSLQKALWQDVSMKMRHLALKNLRKRLRPSQWHSTWESIGGVQGWLDLFIRFSVGEIKKVCRTIGRSAWGAEPGTKREKVAQLFKSLHPDIFPDTPTPTKDQRLLSKQYRHLLPACTSDILATLIDAHPGRWESSIPKSIQTNLLRIQSDTLQVKALNYVFQNDPVGTQWLLPLLQEYPQSPTRLKGFSTSMEFSLTVLERMVTEETQLSSDYCINQIVFPLVRRALRKKADWPVIEYIFDLTVKIFGKNLDVDRRLGSTLEGLLQTVAKSWSRKPALFEVWFDFLLTHRFRDPRKVSIESFERLLSLIPKPKSYIMLRKCFIVTTGIDVDTELGLSGRKWFLSCTLLERLPAKDALGLFDRVRSVQGGEFAGLAPRLDSVLSFGSSLESRQYADTDMWHVVLLRRAGQLEKAERIANSCIEGRKRESMLSSAPEKRAFYAKSAFHFAVASESLKLYGETHRWANRFLGDWLVVKELYQRHLLDTRKFLSGIPADLDDSLSFPSLKERITLANLILVSLFDAACSALRQPAFSENSWHDTLCLPLHAVRHRVSRSREIQEKMKISEEQLYEVIWKDTLQMLIAIEERALTPGYERLHAGSIGGILRYRNENPTRITDELPSTYRFFDNLAQARDQLWRKHRPTVHPAAAALTGPFPRGLPIQHLTEPFILDSTSLEEFAPYIASRRDAAVFMDAEHAQRPIPLDEETRGAIGVFIDDYYFALQMLVPTMLTKEEKKLRLKQAWTHAIGTLSKGRMEQSEASRYWNQQGVFHDASFHEDVSDDWPLVPAYDSASEASEVLEWNPCVSIKVKTQKRTLQTVTYIDISKEIGGRQENSDPRAGAQSTMHYSKLTIPGTSMDQIWSHNRIELGRQRFGIREGLLLSSLMYLDSLSLVKGNILAQPFPRSGDEKRYPALFLSDEFLSDRSLSKEIAIDVLRAHLESVPPPLLARLVEKATDSLESIAVDTAKSAELERLAVSLIEMLSRCDKPRLAIHPALRVVFQRPSASSSFRHIFSAGFFRRLSEHDVKNCITLLADGILKQMDEHAKATKKGEEGKCHELALNQSKNEKSQPFVKVTTVKFLAQLLRDTEITAEAFALSILEKLNKAATHVDIRREVMNSLLSTLKTASARSAEQTLVVLESMIPIMGNIKERQPLHAEDWTQCQKTLQLPSLKPTYNIAEDAPILASLLKFLKDHLHAKSSFVHGAALMNRIIIPVVEHLKMQTKQWVSIFLRKHGFEETSQEELRIPSLPWEKSVWAEVMNCATHYSPLSFLDEYFAYLRYNIESPAPLVSFIQRLRGNVALRDTSEVQIFLNRFGDGPAIIRNTVLISSTTALLHPAQLSEAITIKTVQEHFLKLYTSLLWHDNEKLENLHCFEHAMWSFRERDQLPKKWAETHQPMVEAMILYVESLRTREWQKDPARRPPFLPDTFQYRMWILQYAAQHSSAAQSGDHEAHSRAFADQLAKISNSLAGTVYHKKFPQLQKAMKYLRGDDRARVACYLGDISKTTLSWLTQPDVLRVELAAGFVHECSPNDIQDDQVKARVVALTDSWRTSDSEEVRRLSLGCSLTKC